MNTPHISYDQPVLLIGGGPVDPDILDQARRHATPLIAVDSGANRLASLGLRPDWIIGDLDSIDIPHWQAVGVKLAHLPEQDTTDFHKALRIVKAPLMLGVGFSDGRLDHSLAALSAIAGSAQPVVLLSGNDTTFRAPDLLNLNIGTNARFSIFPFGPVTATSTGLKWPLDSWPMIPDGQIGTSNETTGPVTLRLTTGPALVIVDAMHIDAVITALGA